MIIRLDPPFWLSTPKGEALAHLAIIETEMDIVWVCAQQETGECWSWNNKDIRFMNNQTIGRMLKKELSFDEMTEILRK